MRVLFPAYRRFSAARIEANDAMMALLIGSRLGEHALATSAASDDALLPQLFGRIAGIERVNRTVGDAAALLGDAERHLTYMAIPYVLAVHGAFLVECAGMLRDDGHDDPHRQGLRVPFCRDLHDLPINIAHEYVAERAGGSLQAELLEQFHLARRIRNRIIHFAGHAGARLLGEYRSMSGAARQGWEGVTKRPLSLLSDNSRLDLADSELIAVLAISRNLGQGVNELLVSQLSQAYWARLIVNDYRTLHPGRFAHGAQRLRRLRGYARERYSAVGVTDAELAAAAG